MTARPLSLYALVAGVLLTAVVMGLDAAQPRAGIPEALRAGGAAAMGPVLTRVADAFPAPPAEAPALAESRARLALAEDRLRELSQEAELARARHITALTETGHQVVLARVVAIGAFGPAGPERVTIDVGSADGIGLDQSVVAADGLVGRTVRVGRTTSDVLVIGAADLVIGARGAQSGLLGMVSSPASGELATASQGELTFTSIAFGEPRVNEDLVTVGSPDDVPFVAGLPIGFIHSVDEWTGRSNVKAALTPAVDTSYLDVVAVIVPEGR